MKVNKWSIALFILIIVDSVLTIYLGVGESNKRILWVMNTFNLSLISAMIIRIFYCLPLLYIVNLKEKAAKFTFILYIGLYIIMGGVTLI